MKDQEQRQTTTLNPTWTAFLAQQKACACKNPERQMVDNLSWRIVWERLNWEIVWQLGIYLVFFLLIVYGLITKTYLQYIHPRYQNYLIFAAFLLLGMSIAQFPRLWQVHLRPRLRGYLWLLAPAFFFFFLLQPDLQGLALAKESGSTTDTVATLLDGQLLAPDGTLQQSAGNDIAEELPQVAGAIPIDQLHYAAWLLELNQNPQKYVGKTYTYLAHLEQPLAAGPDEFLPGRPVMLCCAADMQSLGVPAKLNDMVKPHLGSWAYVTGKIYLGRSIDPRFPDEKGAWLEITAIQKAPVPTNSFAYYFGDVTIPD